GQKISPDLRDIIARDSTGQTRVQAIIQSPNADDSTFRGLLTNGQAQIVRRIGNTNTLVVNIPVGALNGLVASGKVDYISPDRPTVKTGHIEDTTGTTLMRSQPATGTTPAYTLDGSGVGVAVLDSGIYAGHNGFKTAGSSRIVANINFTA